MEKSSRNFHLEFLETGSGSGGSTGGVNPRQVLPECSRNTQNKPCDGSGSPIGSGASGALHSTRIFPAPPPEVFGTSTRFFSGAAPVFYLRKKPNEF